MRFATTQSIELLRNAAACVAEFLCSGTPEASGEGSNDVSGADPESRWWRLCPWTTATAVSRLTNERTNQPTNKPTNNCLPFPKPQFSQQRECWVRLVCCLFAEPRNRNGLRTLESWNPGTYSCVAKKGYCYL